jgi:hypothetical protein
MSIKQDVKCPDDHSLGAKRADLTSSYYRPSTAPREKENKELEICRVRCETVSQLPVLSLP